MGRYALWCLNRVATWDLIALADALAVRGWLGSRKHEVTLGDRSSFDQDPSASKPGVLSHEEEDVNEYFVPIAVKCIGDPVGFQQRMGSRMRADGPKRLQDLLAGFPDFFGAAATTPWHGYWKPDGSERMFTTASGTAPHVGFYEIIAERARTDGMAVLVGYSQGGLVARFLAFLDEYLMRPGARSVRGFITVQAPNRGSPLANPLNADTVARGIFAILAGVLAVPVPPAGPNKELGQALKALAAGTLRAPSGPREFDIDAVCALLEAALKDAQAGGSPMRLEMVLTARKWLTGLIPQRATATAFGDLDPANLDKPQSVLGLLDGNPILDTLHGAIIGTDNGLTDFVASGRPWWVQLVLRHFAGTVGLADAIREAEHAYSQIVMNEHETGRTMNGREKAVADAYRDGCQVTGVGGGRVELPPYAHDFVIPSVSHALGPVTPLKAKALPPPEVFLGNYTNAKATHISGGEPRKRDSGSDEWYVKAMLDAIGRRLA